MPILRFLFPAALPLLAACSTVAGQARTVAAGAPFTLRVGEAAAVEHVGALRYDRLVNDSRCRPDVQCIWAGDAELALEWTSATGAVETFSLHTKPGATTHPLGPAHAVRLLSLERGDVPAVTLQVDPAR
jgi:hypothetical protein